MPRHLPPRGIAKRSVGCAAALLGVLLPSHAAADVALTSVGPAPGLVALPDPFRPTLPFLAAEPAEPEVLAAGSWRLDAALSAVNQWAHERALEPYLNARPHRAPLTLEELRALEPREGSGLFHVDGEVDQLTLALARGFGGGIQAELRLPVRRVDGGFTDAVVEAFHGALGFDDAGRDGVRRDVSTLYLRSTGVPGAPLEIFVEGDRGAALGDVQLAIKGRLPEAGRWRLALQAILELPTGDEDRLEGSGTLDAGLQGTATRPLGRGWAHTALGITRLGACDPLRSAGQLTWQAFAGYERPVNPSTHLAIQLTLAQSPLRHLDLPELARPSVVLDLVVKRRIGRRRTLVLGWSDSQFTYHSSPDFALHVAVRHEWG